MGRVFLFNGSEGRSVDMKHEPDVLKEIANFSRLVGNHAGESFNIDCWNECFDLKMESVIEKIFYVAFKGVGEICGLIDPSGISCEIMPQRKIGKFRVDFLVCQINWFKKETIKQAVVECDGHEFHDKNEQQRRYEKQRDRTIQMAGFTIFHFTGKEIKDHPIECACEVLAYLENKTKEDLLQQVGNFDYE